MTGYKVRLCSTTTRVKSCSLPNNAWKAFLSPCQRSISITPIAEALSTLCWDDIIIRTFRTIRNHSAVLQRVYVLRISLSTFSPFPVTVTEDATPFLLLMLSAFCMLMLTSHAEPFLSNCSLHLVAACCLGSRVRCLLYNLSQNDRGEARMDVIDSEMAFLGYYESESYGLTWKVSGTWQGNLSHASQGWKNQMCMEHLTNRLVELPEGRRGFDARGV